MAKFKVKSIRVSDKKFMHSSEDAEGIDSMCLHCGHVEEGCMIHTVMIKRTKSDRDVTAIITQCPHWEEVTK